MSFFYNNRNQTIEFLNLDNAIEISEVTLISLTGLVLFNEQFEQSPEFIDTSTITQGIYIIQVNTSQGIVKRKIALY